LPRFKKVKRYSSFTLKQCGWQYLSDNRLRIGQHVYKFGLSRAISGQIKTVTIKRDTRGHLWVLFSVVENAPEPANAGSSLIGGFDFGLRTFLTDDNGRTYHMPQYFKRNAKRVTQLSRTLSRKQAGSQNYGKAQRRLAKAHARLANQRRDFHFKLARQLLAEYDILCFEDLNMRGMQRLWGRKIGDLGFGNFFTILEHLDRIRGKRVIRINRFEPTTQRCSHCRQRQKVELHQRTFICAHCGFELDRDHNAAINIRAAGAAAFATQTC
jgi:putative transposase